MPSGQFTADGAYNGNPTYEAVIRHSPRATVVIPPRANAVEKPASDPTDQRNQHIAAIDADGRMKWQLDTSYGKRSLVENAIGEQIDHRHPAEGTLVCSTADGSGHWLRRPETDARMRPPEIRPMQKRYRIARTSKTEIHLHCDRCTKATKRSKA